MSTKINVILDIWEQGYGVTTLHVYHSVIPVEAYTREACMIEAMSKLDKCNHVEFSKNEIEDFLCFFPGGLFILAEQFLLSKRLESPFEFLVVAFDLLNGNLLALCSLV